MRNKYLFMIAIALLFASNVKAQQIVDVRQVGDKIVISYDISAPADFVRLYVSTDGGKNYRGPMKQVKGDLRNVPAGFNHSITWDVLKEFRSFKSDNVKFKLSIKQREKWVKESFFTLNSAYSPAPQFSFGLSLGQVKHFGWFVSLMTNGGFKGLSGITETDGNGYTSDGHLPMYTGKTSTDRLSIIAGGMVRVSGPLCFRVGVGYGVRNLNWQSTEGEWFKNKEYSVSGLDYSAGVQLNFNSFVLSLEAVSTNFQTIEGKLGLGYAIH